MGEEHVYRTIHANVISDTLDMIVVKVILEKKIYSF